MYVNIGCMDVGMYEMQGCMDGWMDSWMDGFMDGWMGMLSRLRVATISSHKYETVPSLI